LFFGAAPELDRYLEAIETRIAAQNIKLVILRLKRARNPDVVCIERLEHFLREESAHGVTILLAGVRRDTLRALKNIGFETWFPADQVFPEEKEEYSATLKAVRYAYGRIPQTYETNGSDGHLDLNAGGLYYLV
jgi:SulP family sulfate permease